MLVRPARPEEWQALRTLRLRALAEDPMAFGATLAEEERLAEDEWRRRATPAPDRTTFLAERDGALVGLVTALAPEKAEAEIVGLWSAPEARGAGAGRALMDAAVAWAQESGAGRITLWVNTANAPALRLYERCGFAPLGEPRPGTRHPERRYVQMGRKI